LTIDDELATLLAKLFIQRKDVKAVQIGDGGYRPVREPWKMGDLRAHVAGKQTFGHYTNDQDGLTKLIVFDIDLDKVGTWVEVPDVRERTYSWGNAAFDERLVVHPSTPREDWRDRKHPGRNWYKQQLRCMVELITSAILSELSLRCASAYSGNKGCHVYAFFDEPTDIGLARELALEVLAAAGDMPDKRYKIYRHKGKNFFKYDDPDPYTGYSNLTIEIFPKQDSMEDKDFGNLVRLPLGVNHKGPTFRRKSGGVLHEPTFFIDQRLPYADMQPHPDPVKLLTTGEPYGV
jgi:hypothetical protein